MTHTKAGRATNGSPFEGDFIDYLCDWVGEFGWRNDFCFNEWDPQNGDPIYGYAKGYFRHENIFGGHSKYHYLWLEFKVQSNAGGGATGTCNGIVSGTIENGWNHGACNTN